MNCDKELNPRGVKPNFMRSTENSINRERERKRDRNKINEDYQSNSLSSRNKKKIQNTNNTGDSNKDHHSRAVSTKTKDKKRIKSQPNDLKKNPENIGTLSSVSVFTHDSRKHKRANLDLTRTIESKLSSEMAQSLKVSGFNMYIYIYPKF